MKLNIQKFQSQKPNSRGVTLIELLVTLMILSVLALAAVPYGQVSHVREREDQLRKALAQTRQAIDTFKRDFGRYPVEFYELEWANQATKFTPPSELNMILTWGKPYLRLAPPINPFSGDNYAWIIITSEPRQEFTVEEFFNFPYADYGIYDIRYPKPTDNYYSHLPFSGLKAGSFYYEW